MYLLPPVQSNFVAIKSVEKKRDLKVFGVLVLQGNQLRCGVAFKIYTSRMLFFRAKRVHFLQSLKV